MSQVFETHGMVSWTELTTTDPEAAKAFYGEVFGWRFQDSDMGEDGIYSVIQVGEQQIGGIMATPALAQGHPPTWSSYVTVDDLEATLAKATNAGGRILFGPKDIPEVGRFALVQDPQGANIMAIAYHMKP